MISPRIRELLTILGEALQDDLDQQPSPTSNPTSPTASTPPTPTSDAATMTTMLSSMMETNRMMLQTFERISTEMREMAVELVQGRPQTPDSSPSSAGPLPRQQSEGFNYDDTPLAPGIEAILQREMEETELNRLQKERNAIQERLRALQLDEQRASLLAEDGSPSPWLSQEDQPPRS